MNITTNTSDIRIHTQKLMEAISFTEDELALNEKGYFSEKQQNRLKPKVDLYIWLCVIVAFFSFSLALIGFFGGEQTEAFILMTTVAIIAFGVSFYGIFWSLALKSRILSGFGVKKIEGVAQLMIQYSSRNSEVPYHFLHIGDVKFHLNETTYDAFDKRLYKVYYFTLLRNELLSGEALN